MKFLFTLVALASFVAISQQQQCSVNEVYKYCGGCDQYCNEGAVFCTQDCKPGCYCQDGYKRSVRGGICIPKSTCQQQQCSVNEEYKYCGGCDQYCNEGAVFCTQDCKPGCYCQDGYKRSVRGGICIPKSTCQQQQCSVNEVYKYCGGCDQYCNEGAVFCTQDCKPGCYCQDGYKRSVRGGICIPKSTCQQQQCSVNEVYKYCGGCDQYCNEGAVFCTQDCKPGCYCQDGYKRSVRGGICVPKSACQQQQCSVNEVYKYCGGCDQYCNEGAVFCTQDCKPGCYCQDGYKRSVRGGICIPKSTCQQQQCSVNEVYKYCGGCDQYCNEGAVFCTQDCKPGCYCQDGYKRSVRGGICVPKSACQQQQCSVNEVYKYCGGCDQYCNEGAVFCTQDCKPGCYCQDGYKRSVRGGICIPKSTCQQQQCSVNEVYKYCGGCDQYCNEGAVFCTQDCKPGCYCQDGYKRSVRGGICVPKSACQQQQCSVNEVYKYCGGCDQYCNEGEVFCTQDCKAGCYCQEGYKRSFRGGICIPISTCPVSESSDSSLAQSTAYQCGKNEVFQQCGVGWQCEDYCGRGANACAYCQPGCYCRPGYIRTGPEYDATCIPENQCPRIQDVGSSGIQETGESFGGSSGVQSSNSGYQCGKNEVFQQCGVGMGCEDYCGRGANACAYCQPGCYCRPGYVRSGPEYDAICIPKNQCYQCGKNEVFQQCGVGWQCEDYCGRGANACAYCEAGCYCRPGYVRSGPEYDAICIPQNQCPRAQDVDPSFVENAAYQCGKNEVFQQCGVGWQCEDYCGRGANACAYCQPGCYCRPGYLRSGPESTAKCIPKNQCPRPRALDGGPSFSQGPDYDCRPDEVFTICGVGPECEDYCGRGANACAYCQRGCYCKQGTIRAGASNRTRCIPDNKCSVAPKCFKNEFYSDCGTACPADCENKNPVCTKNCVAGCFCKEGFIRMYADLQTIRYKCIPQDQCPPY